MKPAMCLKRDDCMRACVASILELETEDVPHFFENWQDENGDEINRLMQEWFAARGLVLAPLGLPGDWTLARVGEHMTRVYEHYYYVLWCNSGGDHAVVGRNSEIVWNPAWYKVGIDGPHSSGVWIIWLIARL